MTSPTIQKDIINCCGKETTKRIIEELGDDYFCILADESSDVTQKEQLALCFRYVDSQMGMVVERFLGLVHVRDTTALTLNSAIVSLLVEHSLSPSKIRGQGYNGASNIKGEINGLKTFNMTDTPPAYYVHCFAHQLQLALVVVDKDNNNFYCLFETIDNLLNVVGVSCKRGEMIRESQAAKVVEALKIGENLRADRVLNVMGKTGSSSEDRFWIQNHLCLPLQRRDQDIVNAMSLVSLTKEMLQKMRDDGWEALLNSVTPFCKKYDIVVPDIDSPYISQGRPRWFVKETTNLQHFLVEIFIVVIDLKLGDLDELFDEANTELLICMACLNPTNCFSSFDKEKVIKLVTFYPSEFSSSNLIALDCLPDLYIKDMQRDVRFWDLHDLGALSMMLVKTNKHMAHPNIYFLIKLVLILSVATTSMERVFSGMTYVINRLRSSMGDQLLNDSLVTFVEKDVFLQISDDAVIDRFQNMKTRRTQL